jgi:hypothetical protein
MVLKPDELTVFCNIRLIGGILVAKFPCVVRCDAASELSDDGEVNVVA